MGSFSNGGARVPLNEIAVGTGSGITGFPFFTFNPSARDIITTDTTGFVLGEIVVTGLPLIKISDTTGLPMVAQLSTGYLGTDGALTLVGNGPGSGAVSISSQFTTGAKTANMTTCVNKPGLNNVTTPAKWLRVDEGGNTYWLAAYAD